MTGTWHRSRPVGWLMASLLAIGLWQVWEGSWMYAKAGLAQLLLQRAWTRSVEGEAMPKPWPWADTWPVARLRMPRLSVDLIVLAGAHGRTLAFGPGHVGSSALPGQTGTMMLAGHRDTHFQFLKELQPDDRLEIVGTDGTTRRYRVTERQVMDSQRDSIATSDERAELILVTCFPFDAITTGGPLRFVVRADAIPQADRS
ncbi:MAG: class GN sortase [Nitrospira sp.]|nr:class GN sortase [Nitrospira sp.]